MKDGKRSLTLAVVTFVLATLSFSCDLLFPNQQYDFSTLIYKLIITPNVPDAVGAQPYTMNLSVVDSSDMLLLDTEEELIASEYLKVAVNVNGTDLTPDWAGTQIVLNEGDVLNITISEPSGAFQAFTINTTVPAFGTGIFLSPGLPAEGSSVGDIDYDLSILLPDMLATDEYFEVYSNGLSTPFKTRDSSIVLPQQVVMEMATENPGLVGKISFTARTVRQILFKDHTSFPFHSQSSVQIGNSHNIAVTN